jgi:hypothetical protein
MSPPSATLRWLVVGGVILVLTGAAAGALQAHGVRSTGSAFSRRAQPARCPKRSPRLIPRETWAPATHVLAPPGVSAIRLCRYSGLNSRPPLTLVHSSLHVSRRLVAKLVREFDKLPSFGAGVIACPADDASQIVVRLAYRARHAVTVAVGLTGCARVTNGSVVRTAFGFGSPRHFGPQLLAELERLTGYRGAVF